MNLPMRNIPPNAAIALPLLPELTCSVTKVCRATLYNAVPTPDNNRKKNACPIVLAQKQKTVINTVSTMPSTIALRCPQRRRDKTRHQLYDVIERICKSYRSTHGLAHAVRRKIIQETSAEIIQTGPRQNDLIAEMGGWNRAERVDEILTWNQARHVNAPAEEGVTHGDHVDPYVEKLGGLLGDAGEGRGDQRAAA